MEGGSHEPEIRDWKDWYKEGKIKKNSQSVKQLQQAIVCFNESLKINTENYQALIYLAEVKQKLGDNANALQFLDRAIKLDVKKCKGHFEKGRILRNLGWHKAAVENFQECLLDQVDQRITQAEIHLQIGKTYRQFYETKLAEDAYKQCLDLAPDNINALICLGNLMVDINQQESQTFDYYNRALDIQPESMEAYLAIAQYQYLKQRYKQSELTIKDQIFIQDPNNSQGLQILAMICIQTSDNFPDPQVKQIKLEEAWQRIQDSHKRNPTDKQTLLFRGKILLELGEIDRALTAFSELYEIDKNFPDLQMSIGDLWYNQINIDKALAYYRNQEEMMSEIENENPAYVQPHDQVLQLDLKISDCYYLMKKYDEAIKKLNYEQNDSSMEHQLRQCRILLQLDEIQNRLEVLKILKDPILIQHISESQLNLSSSISYSPSKKKDQKNPQRELLEKVLLVLLNDQNALTEQNYENLENPYLQEVQNAMWRKRHSLNEVISFLISSRKQLNVESVMVHVDYTAITEKKIKKVKENYQDFLQKSDEIRRQRKDDAQRLANEHQQNKHEMERLQKERKEREQREAWIQQQQDLGAYVQIDDILNHPNQNLHNYYKAFTRTFDLVLESANMVIDDKINVDDGIDFDKPESNRLIVFIGTEMEKIQAKLKKGYIQMNIKPNVDYFHGLFNHHKFFKQIIGEAAQKIILNSYKEYLPAFNTPIYKRQVLPWFTNIDQVLTSLGRQDQQIQFTVDPNIEEFKAQVGKLAFKDAFIIISEIIIPYKNFPVKESKEFQWQNLYQSFQIYRDKKQTQGCACNIF